MEDRFKFRVWDKKIELWKGNYKDEQMPQCNLRCDTGEIEIINKDYARENFVIMQCTGLKDKNGKLIYEGDIVKKIDSNALGYYRERICEISWDDNFHMYGITTTLGDGYGLYEYDSPQLEIIGNIYENSELLERN